MFTLKTNINQFNIKPTKKRYKVIINAGGGVFGYIITNLMSFLDQDIYKKVDVVAGTSIGGILTLLYTINSNYKTINSLFEYAAPKIFKKKMLGGFTGPMYDNTQLRNFITQIIGDKKLSDIEYIRQNQLYTIIPTLDFNLTQPRIFENINLDPTLDMKLVDIALATSAAPTYFPAIEYMWKINNISKQEFNQRPINEQIYLLTKQITEYRNQQKQVLQNIHYEKNTSTLIDGGVIQNIPIITTFTCLRSELGLKPQDIDIFVIGTGDDYQPKDISAKEINKWNYMDWLTKFLIPYVTESNELTSVYWGSLMGFNSFCYYNPLKVKGKMDNVKIMPTLKNQCKQVQENFKKQLYQFIQK